MYSARFRPCPFAPCRVSKGLAGLSRMPQLPDMVKAEIGNVYERIIIADQIIFSLFCYHFGKGLQHIAVRFRPPCFFGCIFLSNPYSAYLKATLRLWLIASSSNSIFRKICLLSVLSFGKVAICLTRERK